MVPDGFLLTCPLRFNLSLGQVPKNSKMGLLLPKAKTSYKEGPQNHYSKIRNLMK